MRTLATRVRRLFVLILVLAGSVNTLLVQAFTNVAGLSHAKSHCNSRPLCLSDSTPPPSDLARTSKATRARVNEAFGKLPLSFEANRGHASENVKFVSRGNGYSLLLSSTDATLMLNATPGSSLGSRVKTIGGQCQVGDVQVGALRMKLVGARSSARLMGLDELPGKSNYFIGDDKSRWLANVPNYSKVKYEQVYPGIDLIYYGNQRRLEYDFHVAPGARPGVIRILFEGVRKLRIGAGGDLLIETAAGEVRQHRPDVFQVKNGIKRGVAARYVVKSERVMGFVLGKYDSSLPLIIDPVLVYSTYLGGSEGDQANAVAVDADGNAYVTGSTLSTRFPVSHPLQRDLSGYFDVFVAKLTPSGNTLLYSTYLGGSGDDQGNGIAVDSSGSAYVTGKTGGAFPTTANAFQTDKPGGYDAFVTKISPAGDALVYSTYLGGEIPFPPTYNPNAGIDIGYGIAVDREGNAYVTGLSYSPGFPTKKALQPVINSGGATVVAPPEISSPPPPPPIFSDAFVTKLNPSGTALVYSTFVGGFKDEQGRGIAIDSSGSAYVTGITDSINFLTSHALQPAYGGDPSDAFLIKLEPSGRALVFSTFLGGAADDEAYGVTVDAAGSAYLTGETTSINFPTTPPAFQTTMGGSPIFKSTDGGDSWNPASAGLPDNSFNALAIDPRTPATLYAGMGDLAGPGGAFKSTDGGGNWFAINNGLFASQTSSVSFLTIDPKTPSTLYALSLGAIFKTTDSGNSWNFAARTMPGFNPLSLVIDPTTPTTLYSGGNACPPPPSPLSARDGLSTRSFSAQSSAGESASTVHQEEFSTRALNKSTDGGVTWSPTTFPSCAVSLLAIDPKTSSTIYTTTFSIIFKSTDDGNTWRNTSNNAEVLAIDPANPATVYAGISFNNSGKVTKSTDGGSTWSDTGLSGVSIKTLAIDPVSPNTIYAGANNLTLNFDYLSLTTVPTGFGGGVFKSTDGGTTWSSPSLIGATIQALVVDPLNPSTLYAGAFRDSDAFVAKITAAGARVYSTLLGGAGRDTGIAIAVDSAGRAYITGETFSGNLPTRDAIQSTKASGILAPGAFVTVLDAAGATLVYSTHLGGSGVANKGDVGMGIAVDAFGKAYVAGQTASGNFPTTHFIQPAFGGSVDAFVSKLAFPPRIVSVSISGKNLSVTGDNFDKGAVILINGVEQRTRNDQSAPGTVLIGKKAAKSILPGQVVKIRVRNSDDTLSDEFAFARSVE